MAQILVLLESAVSAVSGWFTKIMTATGAGTLYIAMMSVVLCCGILLSPLLGSVRTGLSDMVHKPRNQREVTK